jgi:hypothetical protein
MAMNKELFEKLAREEELSPAEHLMLEEALESGADWGVIVRGSLDGPEPSMAWRSGLNQKLAALQPRRRRQAWLPAGIGFAAVAACGAWAAFFMLGPGPRGSQPVAAQSGDLTLEMAIADVHRDALTQADAGVYVPAETTLAAYNWSELGSR